jgi:hypothetical protein
VSDLQFLEFIFSPRSSSVAGSLEILENGLIETDEQIMQLAGRYGQVVIPSENEDLDLTHWWLIVDDGTEMLYVGTLETFTAYISERNGSVQ